MKTDLAEFHSIPNLVDYAGSKRSEDSHFRMASEPDEEEDQVLEEWRRIRY